jgi:hypothetical protein
VGFIHGTEKGFVAAVPHPQPHEPSGIARLDREKYKVLSLAEKNTIFADAVLPKEAIIGFFQMQFQDMKAIMSALTQVDCQCDGQLIVDQESHVVSTTT